MEVIFLAVLALDTGTCLHRASQKRQRSEVMG